MLNKERKVIEIKSLSDKNEKLKVAAYARVSSDSEDQLNSFTAQVRYYRNLIEDNKTWELVDIYADEGITGVSMEKRAEFKRMLNDCQKGKIDRIITKSTSRFSRNTLDTLKTIRELKSIGVTVYFEKENIDTGILTSENLLTLYSLFAQEESKTISENCKKGIRMSMSKGTYTPSHTAYGYTLKNKELVINPDEAQIVHRIFSEYLSGKGATRIAMDLNKDKIPLRNQNAKMWNYQSINVIIKNEKYIGDTLYQKSFNDSELPYKSYKNKGELPQYYVENSHEPIISKIEFKLANLLMDERSKAISKERRTYPLSKKIKCKNCGGCYTRKMNRGNAYWTCKKHDISKDYCPSQIITENDIYKSFIRLYNKLKNSYSEIFIPMISQIQKLKNITERNNPNISKINKEIADLLEQNQVLKELQTKEVLDPALFISQSNEINQKIIKLNKEKSQIIIDNDYDDILDKTMDIVDTLEKGPTKINDFDTQLFDMLIENIYCSKKETIDFKLINGLILTERL